MTRITPELLLDAYARGIFPMAEHRRDDRLYWVDPERRGILPLADFHVPRSLAKVVRREPYVIRIDTAFEQVVEACAEPAKGRRTTWISHRIVRLYSALHAKGHAHSIEAWDGDTLVGGLYGVRLGAAFFGESMFSRADDASKIALVHLVARMKAGGFRLLDTQFVTRHLGQFGAIEVPRPQYLGLLHAALAEQADFFALPQGLPGAAILQSITQTS
ncbi:leucyl/phenylalanyl-tRNA--protein transferase [Zavarzinia sp. CC-PAN008]|uniref:leucyl/phenylalanyl-tRNA--protein transferase n=1 Tax=Zavarzinia sp. CC-PAN008 TaxID=3243332 RepID=UPI003F74A7CA